jgi:SNF2 family DNA or RNA helicase
MGLYERYRIEAVRMLEKKGSESRNSSMNVMSALLRLRQICCDPRLVECMAKESHAGSAKLELLCEMVSEMVEEGRKILIFSQFVSMLDLIEQAITSLGIHSLRLTGQTREREKVVAAFQRGEAPVFLISLKAGGTGLNLTAADVVIHYDPWWNPAAEDQATDRAYRIGQTQPVFGYRLIAAGTVEEKIQTLQARKRALSDTLVPDGGLSELSGDELLALLQACGGET